MAFFSICLISCDLSSDDESDMSAGDFKASVAGTAIDFSAMSGCYKGLYDESSALFIDGGTSDYSNEIDIILVNVTGIGDYIVGDSTENSASYSSVSDDGLVTSYYTFGEGTGLVKVTEYSGNRIAGTFSFTAINNYDDDSQISVTNGTFNLEVSD